MLPKVAAAAASKCQGHFWTINTMGGGDSVVALTV